MTDQMLTSEQIDFFKTNGYLILESFIETETIDSWQQPP